MTCPVCELDRSECPACFDPCRTCQGAGEIADNPGWPDPQHERRFTCPACNGDGMHNPDFNAKTYTETVLEHTRDETAAALFDEAFDELLARQDRIADWTGQQVTSQAVTVIKGSAENSEAGRSPDLARAIPQALPSRDAAGAPLPPAAERADLKEAA